MAEVAQLARKRRKRKKKRKKRPGAQQQPQPPQPPQKYKHVLGYTDPGDGLVRETVEWRDTPQPNPPPRPLPTPQSPQPPASPQPFGVYQGPFGRLQAKRLLDRAGFGARRGEAVGLAQAGLQAAVQSLTRPAGAAQLTGPAPHDDDGNPLAPADRWGHDHLWWLDRMVRSSQPLVERMALVFHDWFATSNAGVERQQHMIDQSNLFRAGCLGSFLTLTVNVTKDPAMLQWLNGNENRKNAPNENYARELMELFTLGADREPTPAYTENDIREAAKGLTGWRNDWSPELGSHNFRFDPNRHSTANKAIFSGPSSTFNVNPAANWNWDDVPRLCLEHPLHASFFVEKLWSYFVPQPPSADTRDALASIYKSNAYAIRPVVEAILMHPDLYLGPPMVKPPVVFTASLLRALGRGVDTEAWAWLGDMAGQQLFWPPNVSGWDDDRWLDTSRLRARWLTVTWALEESYFDPWNGPDYDPAEERDPALEKALEALDYPPLRVEHHNELLSFSGNAFPASLASWQKSPYRAMRQNALQQLIAISPDLLLG
ncbi:MAG: DUF1800 domain-containing protein [Actinobacteria bacterium]|nr:DUF1800 domain-containing protein [Actinomycetota bacterium]